MREDLITQVYLFCKKISMPVFYTLLGIMANYTDHYRKGTLTKRQAIISGLFGIVSGAAIYEMCMALGFQRHLGYVVPVATMAGERILPFLLDNNTKLIARFINKKFGGTDESSGIN